jgi:hypothetical protein
MFWWSWSDVKVTGGGALEALSAFWPIAAAAQTQESETAHESETAKVFRNGPTQPSGNAILSSPQKAIYLGQS